jgi:lysozyme
MNVSDLLRRHEGERLKPYCDKCGLVIKATALGWHCNCVATNRSPGNITIGVGRNLEAEGIELDESALMLKNDINAATLHLMKWNFYCGLDEVRQAACIDLCFNVGPVGFDEFRDLIAELQAGNYVAASQALRNSLADHEEPRRIDELAKMLMTGEWPSGLYL